MTNDRPNIPKRFFAVWILPQPPGGGMGYRAGTWMSDCDATGLYDSVEEAEFGTREWGNVDSPWEIYEVVVRSIGRPKLKSSLPIDPETNLFTEAME